MTITVTKFGDTIVVESPANENGVLVPGETEIDHVRPGKFWGDSRNGKGMTYGQLLVHVGGTIEIPDF